MPARSFGPFTSDGIPVPAGARVQLRVIQTSGIPRDLAKLRFGIAQLEPKGSGGLLLPGIEPGGGGGGPGFVHGSWIAAAVDQQGQGTLALVNDPAEVLSITTENAESDETKRAVAWSPDGKWLAFGGGYSTLPGHVLCDVETGILYEHPFVGLGNSVEDVAFHPDGTYLACGFAWAGSGSQDVGIINMTDQSWDETWPTGSGSYQFGVAWSPSGDLLACVGDNGLLMITTGTKLVSAGWPDISAGTVRAVVWSPDGEYVVCGSNTGRGLHAIAVDGQTEDTDWPEMTAGNIRSLAFSPDGSKLAIGGHSSLDFGGGAAPLHILDVATLTFDATLSLPGTVEGLSWWHEGTRLAAAHQNGDGLTVYDPSDWSTESGWPTLVDDGLGVAFAYDPGNITTG